MEILWSIVLIVHLASWALVVGGWLTRMKAPQVVPGMAHGAAGALLTGIILVGLAIANDYEPNTAKMITKLVIAFIVTALAFLELNKPAPNSRAHIVGGLALINVAVAVSW